MSEKKRDVVTGMLLLTLSLVWMLIVWRTIPPGTGGGDVGPRAFPLLLGALLAVVMVVNGPFPWGCSLLGRAAIHQGVFRSCAISCSPLPLLLS